LVPLEVVQPLAMDPVNPEILVLAYYKPSHFQDLVCVLHCIEPFCLGLSNHPLNPIPIKFRLKAIINYSVEFE
jgi:hypothetical protein